MKSTIAKVKQFIAFLVACAAAATAAGCAGPEIDERQLSPETFTASIEQEGATKTLLDAKTGTTRQVRWLSNDAIALYGASVAYTFDGAVLNTQNTAYFTGSGATPDGGKYKAYYPATIYDPTTHKLTFSEEQTYGGRLSDGRAVVSNLPMYAESETAQLQFRNLCSVLNFQLTGEATDKVTEIVVTTSKAGQYLSGEFTIGTPASAPTMVMTGATGSTNTVKLKCGSGVALSSTPVDFFVAIPAQTYAAGTLTITVKDGTKTLATLSNSTATAAQEQFQRNTIYEIAKEAKARVFQVEFVTTPTMSPTYDSGTKTITLFDADSAGYINPAGSPSYDTTLTFKVTTNLGYEVANSTSRLYVGNSGTTDSDPGQNVSEKTFGIKISKVPAAPARGESSSDPGLTVMKPFSVSATAQVYFSPGNLQYQGSTNTWRFAPRQWDYVGSTKYGVDGEGYAGYGTVFYDKGGVRTKSTNDIYDTDTWKVDDLRKAYDGWIDLFGWGTTGKPYRSESYAKIYPWNWAAGSANSSYYGPVSGDLEGDSDWGVNMGAGYRTPSVEDMQYILEGRSDTFKYLGAAIRFDPPMELTITVTAKEDPSYTAEFTVSIPSMGIRGAILFPDNFAAENAALAAKWQDVVNGQRDWHTPMTENDWLALQAVGCVFLPYGDSRTGDGAIVADCDNYRGCYWLKNRARRLRIHDSRYYGEWIEWLTTSQLGMGNSVRLVKDVQPTSGNGTTEPYGPGGNIGF